MSAFTDFEAFSLVAGTDRTYVTSEPVVWHVGKKDSQFPLTIPAGTTFDISVPHGLGWIQSPHDRSVLPGALVHDVLLREGHDPSFAAAEFRRSARARGVSVLWAWVLFVVTLIVTVSRRTMPENA